VDLARTTLLSAAIATRRDFSTTRLNVQTYYMATEFVKRGMGCSITDIFPPGITWRRR
jgi:hypothetical protein